MWGSDFLKFHLVRTQRSSRRLMAFNFTQEHCRFFSSPRFSDVRDSYWKLREKYSDDLRIQTALRTQFPSLTVDIIQASLAQFHLQIRAKSKLHMHEGCFFTETALEQSSSDVAARLHASFFTGMKRVLEICGGIGSDTLALTSVVKHVISIEQDAVHATMLQHNLHMHGRTNAVILRGSAERWIENLNLASFDAVFADPSRRNDTKRFIDGADYQPELSFFKKLSVKVPVLLKVAPALDLQDKDWHRSFVAVGNECKEQLLFHGFDVPSLSVIEAFTFDRWIPNTIEYLDEIEPRYLIEPHNAIIRSGAVHQYFAELQARPIDPRIAYGLSSSCPSPSKWHQAFEIIEMHPFNKRLLQRKLDTLGFGPMTEIKKRGFPKLPEEIRNEFRFEGSNPGVLILTRRDDEHLMVFAKRCR